MKLYCTAKLLTKLGHKIDLAPMPEDPLDVWYASYITHNGEDIIVAGLPTIQFCILLPDFQRGQHSLLSQQLVQAIRDTLAPTVSQDILDRYIPEDTAFGLDFIEDPIGLKKLNVLVHRISHRAGQYPDRMSLQRQNNEEVASFRDFYGVPSEVLAQLLEEAYAPPEDDAEAAPAAQTAAAEEEE